MSEILHANIFFFITSLAVIVFSILVCLILYQVFKIVKALRRVIDRIDAGSEAMAADMENFHANLSNIPFLSMFLGRRPRRQAEYGDEDDE